MKDSNFLISPKNTIGLVTTFEKKSQCELELAEGHNITFFSFANIYNYER